MEVVWWGVEWCEGSEKCGRRGGGPSAPRFAVFEYQVVESDAGSNYHFRAANHRVFDTLLG